MAKRVLSLEGHGDEELGEDDAISDVTPPGEDAPPADGEDPPIDGEEPPTDGEDPAPEDTEEAELEEKKNAVIELADTDDLAVDELANLQDKDDQKEAKKELKKEEATLYKANDDLMVLNEACEAYYQIGRGLRSDRGHEVSILKHMRRQYGLASIDMALEDVDYQDRRSIVLEGFKETFKMIIEKILEAIKRVFEYLRKLFRDYFGRNRFIKDAMSKAHESLVKFDESSGKDLEAYLARRAINTERYFTDSIQTKLRLSYNGKFLKNIQIDSFDAYGHSRGVVTPSASEMVERSLNLVKMNEYFVTANTKSFIEGMQNLIGQIKTLHITNAEILKVMPTELLLDDAHRVQADNGYVCPDGKMLFISDGYFDNVSVRSEFATTRDETDVVSCLTYLAEWKCAFAQTYREESNGYFPRLSMPEITEITNAMMKVNAAMDDFRDNADTYEALVTKLKDAMGKANAEIKHEVNEAMEREDLVRQQLFVSTVRAAMSWLGNSSRVFDGVAKHGRDIQVAWGRFMVRQLLQDAAHLKAANSTN